MLGKAKDFQSFSGYICKGVTFPAALLICVYAQLLLVISTSSRYSAAGLVSSTKPGNAVHPAATCCAGPEKCWNVLQGNYSLNPSNAKAFVQSTMTLIFLKTI